MLEEVLPGVYRKRHEQDKHRLFEKRGRTVSPISFPVPSIHEYVIRPQSCPPPQFDSTFLTPERPSKRRRKTSASSTSSLKDLATSPLSSPNSPLVSPTATLTPNSSDFSSSETDSESSCQSETETSQCPSCLVTFKNKKSLKYQHKCSFRYDPLFCRENNIIPEVLTPPNNSQQTLSILSQLCKEDLVKLCILQGWCIPSVYPFVFPRQLRSGRHGTIPLLSSHTASSDSTNLLKKMVAMDDEVKLPKNIVLKKKEGEFTAFLPIDVLTPPSDFFSITETSDNFIVSKAKDAEIKESEDENESYDGDLDSDDSDSDSDSDASDVIYACQRPEPTPWQTPRRDDPIDDDDDLPSPPYTSHTAFRQSNPSDESPAPAGGDLGCTEDTSQGRAACSGAGAGIDVGGSGDDGDGRHSGNDSGSARDFDFSAVSGEGRGWRRGGGWRKQWRWRKQ